MNRGTVLRIVKNVFNYENGKSVRVAEKGDLGIVTKKGFSGVWAKLGRTGKEVYLLDGDYERENT